MKKIFKKIISTTLVMALVITGFGVQIISNTKKVKADTVEPVSSVKVVSYSKWTHKYLVYFNEASNSDEYRLYIDNHTVPLKRVSGSGAYFTDEDISNIDTGDHYLSVTNVRNINGRLQESERVSARFTKIAYLGAFTDIPQVYINAGTISNEYRAQADVKVTIVDQNGGSKGLGCVDNNGSHRDSGSVSKYADLIDSACNMKIRGNTTATQAKKAWNIKLSSKQSLLGMDKGKKWCLLANSMDKSLMRDTLSYNFGLENGVKYSSQSRYVDVYMNGSFYGNYQLCEPVEAKSGRVEVDAYEASNNDILLEYGTRNEEGVDHFSTGIYNQTFDVNDPEKGDDLSDIQVNVKINKARTFLNSFEAVLRDDVNNLEAIAQYIDVDSFINYYIANEYFKNVDFNFSSTRFYIKGDKLYAGPMWDLDLSSGNCKSSYYKSYYVNGDSTKGFYCRGIKWYDRLFKNEEFVERVKQRYYDLQYKIQSLYRTDSTEVNSIDYLLKRYGSSFERNYAGNSVFSAGWTLVNDDGYSLASEAHWQTWLEPIEFLRDWLSRRNDWISSQWGVDMDEAYAKGKAEAETTTPEPTTTIPETSAPTTNPEESTQKPEVTTKSKVEPATGKNAVKKPGKTKVKKAVKKSAKKIKITLKKVKGAKGYQIAVYKSKKNAKANKYAIFYKMVKKAKATVKSKKIKKKKKLYIRARAYRIEKKTRIFGDWSKIKRVK